MLTMTETPRGKSVARPTPTDQLFKHVGDLHDLSAAITALAEKAPDRMTLAQSVFFLSAAMADIAGKPATFTEIKTAAGEAINKSLHTTYKVFLEGPKRSDRPNPRQQGLNWLSRTPNPADEREKFLKLTPDGRAVVREVVAALLNKDI